MLVVFISVFFNKIFDKNVLIKDGWEKRSETLFKKHKNNYEFTYHIKNKLGGSYLSLAYKSEEIMYKNLAPFPIRDAWNLLWKKNTEINAIEIYTKEDLLDTIIEYGWEKVDFIPNSNVYMYNDNLNMPYSYTIKDGYNILAYEEKLNTDSLLDKLRQAGINV
ncbi:hypothetical protein [Alkaliphilus sp. B6464]|uniref:hypothetical protein n=1 Tax=Alkaliphilus sp. B6464 TaxID=2731219 RepID=UPI001BA9929F|nr:hypothetical protein [Alkaliphilus sp. B6464]QUH22178.1 hypothetical protein HYG84_19920 [Alkaliphilus sp. B6464]